MDRVVVIVPAHNEERNVSITVDNVRAATANLDARFELMFVDDGSADGTWAEVLERAAGSDDVGGLRLSRRFGKESAIAAGLDRVDADAVVIMDADTQHPADLIPRMFEDWRKGAKIVHGVKRAPKLSPSRKLGTQLFYGLTQRLSGIPIHGSSDFKLLDRSVVELFRQEIRERNRFFRVTAEWAGFDRTYVEFDVVPVAGRQSRWSFGALLRLAIRGMTSFSSLPIHVPTLLGVALFALALVVGGWQAVEVARGQGLDDTLVFSGLILFVGSLILVSLGIVGEYIATIQQEVKRRPIYIVEEALEAGDE